MKMNGKSKKLIVGLAGFCMAAVIFAGEIMTNVTDVQATTKVFDAITDRYKGSNTFTILEIEPDESSLTPLEFVRIEESIAVVPSGFVTFLSYGIDILVIAAAFGFGVSKNPTDGSV